MSLDAIEKFIGDLAVHYPTPKHGSAEAEAVWLRSMVAELKGSSAVVLDRAARHIIQTRKYRNFPLVAECREAIRQAAEEVRFERNMEVMPELRQSLGDEWSTERCKLAHDLKRSDLGKRAAREGWIVSFWHFCRRNRRAPEGREIDQCKQDSTGIEELYSKAKRGECGPMSEAIASLGLSILEKRQRWSEEVLGR